jgi:hypothetical protein
MAWRRTTTWVLAAVLLTACGAEAEPASTSRAPGPTRGPASSSSRPEVQPLPPDAEELRGDVESALAELPAPTPFSGRLLGADMSWPQCPKGMGIPEKRSEGAPMPTRAAEFVVIGLTNGPSFTRNPCLADQVDWARELGLLVAAYSVVSFPSRQEMARLRDDGPYDASTRLGGLRNVGVQMARFNLEAMRDAGLETPIVWIDVEPVRFFDWSDDLVANGAVVQGVARGYREAGYRIGFYSIPSLWQRVVGDLVIGGPEWRAAGETSMAEALSRCGGAWSFQGGRAIFGQWVEDRRDRNVTCPRAVTDLSDWFHKY